MVGAVLSKTYTVAVTPWRATVEPVLQRWLVYWHGRGEPTQFPYYRCQGCHRIVTWHAIRKGGCPCKLSNKLSPAALWWYERARLIILPWWCIR
jgi:hypothetical protein